MEIVELQQNLEIKRNIDYGFLPLLFVKVKQKTFLKDSKETLWLGQSNIWRKSQNRTRCMKIESQIFEKTSINVWDKTSVVILQTLQMIFSKAVSHQLVIQTLNLAQVCKYLIVHPIQVSRSLSIITCPHHMCFSVVFKVIHSKWWYNNYLTYFHTLWE